MKTYKEFLAESTEKWVKLTKFAKQDSLGNWNNFAYDSDSEDAKSTWISKKVLSQVKKSQASDKVFTLNAGDTLGSKDASGTQALSKPGYAGNVHAYKIQNVISNDTVLIDYSDLYLKKSKRFHSDGLRLVVGSKIYTKANSPSEYKKYFN